MRTILTFITITILASCGTGEAETSAKAFAARHFEGHKGIECMTRDSDSDGYVSCTIFLPNEAVGIECATERLGGCGNSGCRMAMGKSAG